jgi:hypothetical protein
MNKKTGSTDRAWLMPVNLSTSEGEIGRMTVPVKPRKSS